MEPRGLPQSVDPLSNDGAGDPTAPLPFATLALLDGTGTPSASVTVPGQGRYAADGSGRIVFTPVTVF